MKTNLIQQKAWSANDVGKRIQASAICIAQNLLRLLQVRQKVEDGIEDKSVIDALKKPLPKRLKNAREAGRELPKKRNLALNRPTEVSLQLIRWLRVSLFRPTRYRQFLSELRPLMLTYL